MGPVGSSKFRIIATSGCLRWSMFRMLRFEFAGMHSRSAPAPLHLFTEDTSKKMLKLTLPVALLLPLSMPAGFPAVSPSRGEVFSLNSSWYSASDAQRGIGTLAMRTGTASRYEYNYATH